ncbi:hypothetical protein [Parabacteroides sp.]
MNYQVRHFNEIWKDAYTNIPFYKQWKDGYGLPDEINSVSELQQWPILTKKELLNDPKKLLRITPPKSYVITSGSTGIPLKLPAWHDTQTKINMWIGRAANGITPEIKTFLIWGHHHLHGTGINRIKNTFIRKIKDYILGYKRISAYDTSINAMHMAYKKFYVHKPAFFIGYSSSTLAFVRCNKGKSISFPPKLILCTAGPLTTREKQEIREFFHAPLCMEYGSVECGVMAYSVEDCSSYNVFWNTHILQGLEDECKGVKNIVTTLAKRYFPLIRYDIGDYLDLPDGQDLSCILKINSIVGRPTDIVTLKNGTSFFAMLIEACVEHLDGIISHQLIVKETELEILLVASRKFTESDFQSVKSRIFAVVPDIQSYPLYIRQVEELNKNKGGKTPIVIRK